MQVVAESGAGEYLLDAQIENVILVGDYNRDGMVSAADYTIWRNTLGSVTSPHLSADGDGSGVVGAGDYQLWKANYGTTFATANSGQLIVLGEGSRLVGDFNLDGRVSAADYTIWRNTLGVATSPHLSADGDGSGGVGVGDYQLWKANYGATFATATGGQLVVLGAGNGSGSAIPLPTIEESALAGMEPVSFQSANAEPATSAFELATASRETSKPFDALARDFTMFRNHDDVGHSLAVRQRGSVPRTPFVREGHPQDLLAIILNADASRLENANSWSLSHARSCFDSFDEAADATVEASDLFFAHFEESLNFDLG